MARDRKRAKQRQARQARAAAQGRRADAATAPAREHETEPTLDRNGAEQHETELDEHHEHEPPELASGEVDLVDAQLALGRPELAREPEAERDDGPSAIDDPHELAELEDEEAFEELEDEIDEAEAEFEGREDEQAERRIARRRSAATVPREAPHREGSRVGNFLRGSWRELQRVQWPDRRQVAQATAVVVGFVIVAGAFLGLMDLLAGKIVDLII